jgi:hypothetical protein
MFPYVSSKMCGSMAENYIMLSSLQTRITKVAPIRQVNNQHHIIKSYIIYYILPKFFCFHIWLHEWVCTEEVTSNQNFYIKIKVLIVLKGESQLIFETSLLPAKKISFYGKFDLMYTFLFFIFLRDLNIVRYNHQCTE